MDQILKIWTQLYGLFMDLTEKMDQIHKYGPSGSPASDLQYSVMQRWAALARRS